MSSDDILSDLPIGDAETQPEDSDSGIPETVQDLPTGESAPSEVEEVEEVEETVADLPQDSQPAQVDEPAVEAPESPPEAAPEPTPEDTPPAENTAPAAQEELESTIPPLPSELQAAAAPEPHPAPNPSIPIDVIPHPPVAETNPATWATDRVAEAAAGQLPAVQPPTQYSDPAHEHGDLVTQTEAPEVAPRMLGPGEKISREVAQQWDVMMAQLSDQTRLRVWESGIADLQTLLSTPRRDLERPRGPFTTGQANEIETWLVKNLGIRFAKTRKQLVQAYVPPPIKVGAGGIATRKMTPELAAARKARLDAIRGDTRKGRV